MGGEPVPVGPLAAGMLEQVEEIRVRARARGRTEDHAVYRCGVCRDTTWIETDTRGIVERCRGPMRTGCPAIAHRLEQARKRGARTGRGGESERL